MKKFKFGFIGCGNMGGALITAVAKTVKSEDIAVCDFDKTKAESFAKKLGVTVLSSKEIAKSCDFVVLGVKPQVMANVIAEFSTELKERESVTIITMAAGTSIEKIRSFVGKNLSVIRIMPNTAVTVGEGMILYTCNGVEEDVEKDFLNSFSKAGIFDKIAEEKIDAGCAVSGCGPAFVCMFAEALADAGVECGLPRDKALKYASQTLLGTGKMILNFGSPSALKDAVCSPGGTTIAGVHSLEKAGFRGATMDAVVAAFKKNFDLK